MSCGVHSVDAELLPVYGCGAPLLSILDTEGRVETFSVWWSLRRERSAGWDCGDVDVTQQRDTTSLVRKSKTSAPAPALLLMEVALA